MINGDMVEVAALGDASFAGNSSEYRRFYLLNGSGFQCISVTKPEESRVVKLRLANGYTQPYRVKPTTKWTKVVTDFRRQIDDPDLRFLFDGNHLHNRGNYTVADAGRLLVVHTAVLTFIAGGEGGM